LHAAKVIEDAHEMAGRGIAFRRARRLICRGLASLEELSGRKS